MTPPAMLEIRGEAYIANTDFAHLQAATVRGDAVFANPRNTTAGAIKLLDPKLCAAPQDCGSSPTASAISKGCDFRRTSSSCRRSATMGVPATPDVEACRGIDATLELATS